ncbi:Peptidase C14, caspase catalytic [Corchorus olitorius]|uniref:Peptidase C14, caspase catalytic n=1 Tax=Corchorus olitorius TaxID=93759 RepID=A0A1R3KQY2_9ROSI|nr:Peptidase C14, caspase catalytic [Corchorus olitorius]
MDSGRNIICSGCRQRWVVKASNKSAAIVCPSCRINILEFPNEELQTNQQQQGLRSRIRNFGHHMKSKMHQGTIIPHNPSLNHESSHPNPPRSFKRAVLCGITYNNWKYKLKGTINDVRNMRELLITRFGYPRECIRVLTEEETDPRFIPTRKNIEDSLRWLVNDCRSGDSLMFFYSGHGLRQPDLNNDEDDGFDETICPVDFLTAGMILDDDLNSLIVRPLKPGVTLHAVVDACHSGTILDLSHVYFSRE